MTDTRDTRITTPLGHTFTPRCTYAIPHALTPPPEAPPGITRSCTPSMTLSHMLDTSQCARNRGDRASAASELEGEVARMDAFLGVDFEARLLKR
jgi:hypothetical protein